MVCCVVASWMKKSSVSNFMSLRFVLLSFCLKYFVEHLQYRTGLAIKHHISQSIEHRKKLADVWRFVQNVIECERNKLMRVETCLADNRWQIEKPACIHLIRRGLFSRVRTTWNLGQVSAHQQAKCFKAGRIKRSPMSLCLPWREREREFSCWNEIASACWRLAVTTMEHQDDWEQDGDQWSDQWQCERPWTRIHR